MILIYIARYALGIGIVFLMWSTLKLVAPHNQKIKPNLLWLLIIPVPVVFNVYFLYVVVCIAGSIASEYDERGIRYRIEPTYLSGMAAAIISFIPYSYYFGRYIPTLIPIFSEYVPRFIIVFSSLYLLEILIARTKLNRNTDWI